MERRSRGRTVGRRPRVGGDLRGQHGRDRDLRARDLRHPLRRPARLHGGDRRRGDDARRDHAAPGDHRGGRQRHRPLAGTSLIAPPGPRRRRGRRPDVAGGTSGSAGPGWSARHAWPFAIIGHDHPAGARLAVPEHAPRRVRRRQPADVHDPAAGLRPHRDQASAPAPTARSSWSCSCRRPPTTPWLTDIIERRSRRRPGVNSVLPPELNSPSKTTWR